VSDGLLQSLSPVLEHALELLDNDIAEEVCQCVDDRISISIGKSWIAQCFLGPSKGPEVDGPVFRSSSSDFSAIFPERYALGNCPLSVWIFLVCATLHPAPPLHSW
jgi:hypothetical protein